MRNTLSASGFLAMLLGQGGQIAYAQSVSEVADPSPTADVEQQDQPAKATPLEVITVIGQKIERDLQDTQTSVAVINELDIREQNIINLEDAIQRTANITTLDGANFQIRGVNNRGVAGGGVSPLATVYVDGFALPPSALFGGPTEIWDVSQIEILRGPQSTLQGRASLAGAIVINTAEPSYDWSGRARAIYTTEEERTSYAGAIGGPIIENQVAFRVAAEKADSDGFNFNPFLNEDADPIDNQSIRTKLLIEPAALTDLEVILGYSHIKTSRGVNVSTLAVDDPEDARLIPLSIAPFDKNRIKIATGVVNYDINDRMYVAALAGYNEVDRNALFEVNRDPNNPAPQTFEEVIETSQQELRLVYQGERFEWILGGFLSEEERPGTVSASLSQLNFSGPLAVVLGTPGFFPEPLDPATRQFIASQYPTDVTLSGASVLTTKVETWAIYGDGSWNIDDWTIYAGFRYDVEKQENSTQATVSLVTPIPTGGGENDPLAPVFNTINSIIAGQLQAANSQPCINGETQPPCGIETDDFGGFLPKLGVGYAIDEDRSISFTVQRGYRSGGAGINPATATGYQFDQEFTWNYELAFRSQWLDNTLTVNANVFYTDWTDQQVEVVLSPINLENREVQNAGESSVYGFELEASYDPTPNLSVYGGVGYAKTEFEEFFVNRGAATLDFAGNSFALAPKWTLNGGVTWRPTTNLIANLNANYASDAYLNAADFQFNEEIDARTLVNFRVGWENDHVGLYFAGNNLLDEDYRIGRIPALTEPIDVTLPISIENAVLGEAQFASFGDPRTFSFQIEAFF